MYFKGRVTLFFANNYLTEYRITMEILTQFSSDPDVIFSSHTMFINASTKEFTLVNNAISSYDIAFEELLYYRLAPPILWSWHIANKNINHSSIQYTIVDTIFGINLNQMDIALLLVVNYKFDIIIDRTLWTLCNYMT